MMKWLTSGDTAFSVGGKAYLFSHDGRKFLGAHVIVDPQQMFIKLAAREICRLQDGGYGRDEKGVENSAEVQTTESNPIFNGAPIR